MLEVKLFGPVQLKLEYVPLPAEGVEVSMMVVPWQNGPLFAAVITGLEFTTAVVEAVAVHPFASVTVT